MMIKGSSLSLNNESIIFSDSEHLFGLPDFSVADSYLKDIISSHYSGRTVDSFGYQGNNSRIRKIFDYYLVDDITLDVKYINLMYPFLLLMGEDLSLSTSKPTVMKSL